PSLAVAYRTQLLVRRALQRERPADGLRSPLAEADIVFAAAALVGVSLEPHGRVRILREIAAVSGQHRVELRLDLGLIVLEVDDEAVEQRLLLRVERRDPDAGTVAGTARRRPVLEPACAEPGIGAVGKRVRTVTAAGRRERRQRAESPGVTSHVVESSVCKQLFRRSSSSRIRASGTQFAPSRRASLRPWIRRPDGLAHVAGDGTDLLMDPSVRADRGEHAA